VEDLEGHVVANTLIVPAAAITVLGVVAAAPLEGQLRGKGNAVSSTSRGTNLMCLGGSTTRVHLPASHMHGMRTKRSSCRDRAPYSLACPPTILNARPSQCHHMTSMGNDQL
jgi:hypothetical protein